VPEVSSLIAEAAAADFHDTYRVQVHRPEMSARALYLAIMSSMPEYFSSLLALRDILVRPFGIKATRDLGHEGGAQGLGLFPLIHESEDEIVLGAPDSHLDFKLGVTRDTRDGQTSVYVTTIVRYNRPIGRIYLNLIKPFHVAIIKGALDRASKRGLI
jgi:hypothetical protein